MPLAATTSSTKAVSRKPRLDAMYGPTPHASQGLASHAWDTAAMLTIVLSTAAAGHLLLLGQVCPRERDTVEIHNSKNQ